MLNHQSEYYQPKRSWKERISGPLHLRALSLFMLIVAGHWVEHLTQIYQIYILGWLPKEAGGVLGLWFPTLNSSEVLHFTYNLLLLGVILLLRPGFSGRSRKWWNGALIAQIWHFFEHVLLQVQWLTGVYLFGAAQQISIGQLWFPRPELHFVYNLIVFVPLVIAMIHHFNPPVDEPPHRHERSERQEQSASTELAATGA